MLRMIVVGILLLSAGCAPSTADFSGADFGPPPPADTLLIVKSYMELRLIDAEAARYKKVGGPVKGYAREGLIYGGRLYYGWAECWLINSKNRMGGYTGYYPFFFLIRGDRVVISSNRELSSWNCF